MIKIKRLAVLILIVSFVLAACSSSTSTPAPSQGAETGSGNEPEEVITLRVSSGLNETHSWFPVFFEPWMEQIEKETNGKVQFEVFSGGQLVPIRGELDALQSGTIDVALPLFPIYEPSRFPLTEVTMLPLTNSDSIIAAKAYHELVQSDKAIKDDKTYSDFEFGQYNLKVFTVPPTPPYILSSVNHNFDTIDSFKGKIIRTGGRTHEFLSKYLGASPTTISAADLFEAISRGIVDGHTQAIADWKSYGIEEMLKYSLEGVYLGHFSVVIAMTDEKWNSLPADVQTAFTNATNALQIAGGERWEELGNEVKQINMDAGGQFTHIDQLDAETKDYIVAAVENTWLEWIEAIESEGHPGKELAILWRDLILANGGDVPDKIKELQ